MSDKTMPPSIMHVYDYTPEGDEEIWVEEDALTGYQTRHTYIRLENNPDYHVIKKSDVDEDVIDDMNILFDALQADTTINEGVKAWHRLSNALIAQSDPDTVTIPRKVLEWWEELCDLNPQDLKPRIADRLNYRPTTSDGEGE